MRRIVQHAICGLFTYPALLTYPQTRFCVGKACVILVFMAQGNDNDWISQLRARGWGDFLNTALDVLEPLGPLGAQLLWIAQPALGLFVRRDALGALAQALEEPGGIAALRKQLDDEPPPAT